MTRAIVWIVVACAIARLLWAVAFDAGQRDGATHAPRAVFRKGRE
jgi:hypothetical protein